MPGRFEGLSVEQLDLLYRFMPPEPEKRGKGKPPAPWSEVLNTIFYVLITGCRWADVPNGSIWGARSTAHRRLGIWQRDGTWKRIQSGLLGAAELASLIDWERSSIDGSFAAGKGGGEGVEYGGKGKGVTLHALADGKGDPLSVISTGAKQSEREQVEPLLDEVDVPTGKIGRPRKRPKALQLDKGYESKELRKKIRSRGIKPLMPKRTGPNGKARRGRPADAPIDRYKVERLFAWLQRKYRRLAVRWERRNKYWLGFVSLGVIGIWMSRLLG